MQINKNTRLLVVSPHPDDEALGCGGLIGKCKKEKGKVLIVYVSVGDSRQLITQKTETSTRINEINEVEKLISCRAKILYTGKEFCRLDTVPQKDIVEKIEDVVEDFRPNLLVVPCRQSYNQDHRAVFQACITALRPTPKKVRHFVDNVLEYFEPYFWTLESAVTPRAYLDLGEKLKKGNLLDFKIDLYKCHKTQVRKEPFPRSVENLRRWANIYGREIGVEIAEAFNVVRTTIN